MRISIVFMAGGILAVALIFFVVDFSFGTFTDDRFEEVPGIESVQSD